MAKEQQKTYWRSLNELAQNEEYKKFAEREFPENATELTDGVSRRNFLQIMGASIALAGLSACRKPVQKIMPYARQPEHVIPGIPLYYASAAPFRGNLSGIVVETHEGRPTKIEGNELHPDSGGRTNSRQQAAILDLYDQDRSRKVRHNGSDSSWSDFIRFCSEHFAENGNRVAFISEANSSPTLARLRDQAMQRFPDARWVTFEPYNDESVLNGVNMAFGSRLRPHYHFDKARITLSLDDDFMQDSDNNVRYIADFAQSRAIASADDEPARLYVAESNYSLTGSNADHRLRIKSSELPRFCYSLAAALSERVSGLEAYSGFTSEFNGHSWISVLVEELIRHRGESILTAGAEHDGGVHATVAAINLALGNIGRTVEYLDVPWLAEDDQNRAFSELTAEMTAGNIDTVVLVGTNPVFTAPADLNVESALSRVPVSIHLSSHYDETSRHCTWHVPRAHFLETWGDGYSCSGASSIIQPMIQPLLGGKSEVEFVNAVVNAEDTASYDLIRETWVNLLPAPFESHWNRVLHDGLLEDSRFEAADVALSAGFATDVAEFTSRPYEIPADAIELVMRPDPKLHDGRFANNGWLQELPDPMTKITWDNVALLSPNTAERIGIPPSRRFGNFDQPVIRISTENTGEIEIAAWVLPGHADDSITIYNGYGRQQIGRVADQVGVSANHLRTTGNRLFHHSVTVDQAGRTYEIACTQDHHSLEGRPLVQDADLEHYRENPTFAQDAVYVPGVKGDREHPIQLFSDTEWPEHEPQWGMTIDLNSCVGCGVCTIACQAENNIPVIGKREVRRGREMHWIRTDRYFSGDERESPKVMHQPVPCMHCENAPCEQVCPVAATTHSDDGLNQMTYNRCIGTRYCANNCPYKVRRFNFFNYSKEYLTGGDDPEIIQMAMNPDVTVRFRGVMEKCTYCVQRISRAKIDTKNETGNSIKPPDGTVKTACQQACPANAIAFGDLTDRNSAVSIEKQKDRNYMMLEELNVRPRTSYLAKIRNPNREISPAT
ncbi:TAT-variant-translocated molybdopterin oxidoreductase [Balneolales bacterium ANBcel1]|nr:TAT-variant-translocated molybdopterin oxidoreductase [Balneolales bacterium ANBcel1]